MSIAHDLKAPVRPYVPPITPEELGRQNARVIALLDAWDVPENEEEDRRVIEALRKALGPDRVISSRSLFP